MSAQLGGQPVLILKEGTERTRGKDAQSNNIMAAKAIAAAVRTTLGPKGMDKMLVDSGGDVTVTNDGVTILREMDIEHPAAKMIVEVSKTQDDEVGDGTTTAAVLAGELLKEAEALLDQNIHPTVITAGYTLAAEKSIEILKEISHDITDRETLIKLAETAITGKGSEVAKEELSRIAVGAVEAIVDEENGKKIVDIDNIKIEKRVGASTEESQLVKGIIIGKERARPGMPKNVRNAKIALITPPIEFSKNEIEAQIDIATPDQVQMFLDQEEMIVKDIVDRITGSGANVVLCEKGIEDMAQFYFMKAGVLAVERVDRKDMEKLARATGAAIVTSLDEVLPEDLGTAEDVEEKKIGAEKVIFITGCDNAKSVSVFLRGSTEHVLEYSRQALEDALRVVGTAIEDGKYVTGAGSPEVELALRLREYASSVKGREQLAIERFANALEIIPKTLAENAGLDAIDMLLEMRSEHGLGNRDAGLDVDKGKVVNMWERGVIEPLRVKTQAINSATEAAIMILRIDDVLAASTQENPPTGGGMGGMMPGMM